MPQSGCHLLSFGNVCGSVLKLLLVFLFPSKHVLPMGGPQLIQILWVKQV